MSKDHSVAKSQPITLPGKWSNHGPLEKAEAFIADDNMEMSKSTIWKNDRNVQKPIFLERTSIRQKSEGKALDSKMTTTNAFSKNDKNDMHVIQCCAVEINNKSVLENERTPVWCLWKELLILLCIRVDRMTWRSPEVTQPP